MLSDELRGWIRTNALGLGMQMLITDVLPLHYTFRLHTTCLSDLRARLTNSFSPVAPHKCLSGVKPAQRFYSFYIRYIYVSQLLY